MSERDLADGARAVRVSVVLLALLCLLAGGLAGYMLRGAEDRTPTYLEQLAETLSLRPEQVAAIDAVLAEEDREIDNLLGHMLEEMQGPVAERRARTEAALLAALDDAQRARYAQLVQAETNGPGQGER
jgi:hypothetical protein